MRAVRVFAQKCAFRDPCKNSKLTVPTFFPLNRSWGSFPTGFGKCSTEKSLYDTEVQEYYNDATSILSEIIDEIS